MNNQVEIDILLKVTTLITCKEGRKNVGTGTGFFFRHNDKTWLITNRHVLIQEDQNYYPDKIILTLNHKTNYAVQKEHVISLYNENDAPNWYEINRSIDIAALEVTGVEDAFIAELSTENLLPKDVKLGLGEQVLVVGYPKAFYDDINNLPIVRNATVASAYGVKFRNEPIFLIDSALHPGTSGSPIITVPKSIQQYKGGGFSIGGKMTWSFLGINSGEYGGMQLNKVWYAELVIELLNSI